MGKNVTAQALFIYRIISYIYSSYQHDPPSDLSVIDMKFAGFRVAVEVDFSLCRSDVDHSFRFHDATETQGAVLYIVRKSPHVQGTGTEKYHVITK